MGNIPVSITVETASSKKEKAYEAMEEAFDEARRIENEVSEWGPQSQTTLLNRNAGGRWMPIGQDLMAILREARKISEATGGAFDVTFASRNRRATFRDVEILPELFLARLKRKGAKIGVSGIAKGYIVDRMSDVLNHSGFEKYLVDAGDLFARGRWTIGIRDPGGGAEPLGAKPICRITVRDRAVSTSGLYERGPHILDPKTKKPVRGDFQSVTVLAPRSILADALATAGFVMGKWGICSIQHQYPGVQVLAVDAGTRVHSLRCNK